MLHFPIHLSDLTRHGRSLSQALHDEILADFALSSDFERSGMSLGLTTFELPVKKVEKNDESLKLVSLFVTNENITSAELADLAYRSRSRHYEIMQRLIAADLVAEGCFDDTHPQRPRTAIDPAWWNRPGLVDLSDNSLSPYGLGPSTPGSDQNQFRKFSDIRVFSPAELSELIPDSQRETLAKDVPKHKGGRPPEYDWESFGRAAESWVTENGFPKRKATLEKFMKYWCQANWGEEPADSLVRKHVSSILMRLQDRA
jgi:hypothetical protein